MGNRLSHSAINRYKMCGESYRLHYVERIRPNGTSSALLFGAALDNALNVVLTIGNESSAEEVFEQSFRKQTINGKEIDVPTSTLVSYSKADWDKDLFTEEDAAILKAFAEKRGLPEYTNHLSVRLDLNKKETLTESEQAFLNCMSWLSLRHKGLLMIQAYRTKVMPEIEEVYAVQKEFNLKNGAGDNVVGLVDLIAKVRGHGTVILDNKTAGRPYERDSARNSEQLALYLHELEEEYKTRKIGYIVLLKNVNKNKVKICKTCGSDGSSTAHTTCNAMMNGKRCKGEFTITMNPEIDVQIIIDEMPEDVEAVVLENVDTVNTLITDKVFEKNTECCEKWFGSRCPYFNLCHGGSEEGLTRMKKESK